MSVARCVRVQSLYTVWGTVTLTNVAAGNPEPTKRPSLLLECTTRAGEVILARAPCTRVDDAPAPSPESTQA